MTHSTPMIMGDPNGNPHSTFVDTEIEGDFQDTLPSMPAPFYGTATGRHRYLPPPRVRERRTTLFVAAVLLVALCAVPAIFFVR